MIKTHFLKVRLTGSSFSVKACFSPRVFQSWQHFCCHLLCQPVFSYFSTLSSLVSFLPQLQLESSLTDLVLPRSTSAMLNIHRGPEVWVWVWVFLRAESYVYKSFCCPTFQYREPITLIRQKVMSWWRGPFYTAEQKANMRFKGWFTPQWDELKMDEGHARGPTQERLSGLTGI